MAFALYLSHTHPLLRKPPTLRISLLKERLNHNTCRHSSSQSIYLGLKTGRTVILGGSLLPPQSSMSPPRTACAPTISARTSSQPHLTVSGGGICVNNKSVAIFNSRLTFAPTAAPSPFVVLLQGEAVSLTASHSGTSPIFSPRT